MFKFLFGIFRRKNSPRRLPEIQEGAFPVHVIDIARLLISTAGKKATIQDISTVAELTDYKVRMAVKNSAWLAKALYVHGYELEITRGKHGVILLRAEKVDR